LAHVLGAGGGAFAVFATEALVDKIRSADATFAGVGLNVALVLIALAVVLVPVGPARGAAVVALVVSTPLIWIFVFYGNGQSGSGWLRGIFLLSAAMYLGFYSLLWTRGRAVFLALTLLFVASYVEFEVHRQFESPTSAPTVLAFPGGALTDPFNAAHLSSASTNNLFQRTGDDQAIAALLLGVAFLAVGGALHRKRYSGAAVPFLVVGAIEGFAAAAVLGPNEGSLTLGGLLAAAVGALLALGGHGEGRRGSVWIGVIAVVVGVLVAITDWTTDRLGLAGYSALVALGLIGAAFALGQVLGEPPDGGEPTTP
jgi:LPXTG-motif cell wall-anchored protein